MKEVVLTIFNICVYRKKTAEQINKQTGGNPTVSASYLAAMKSGFLSSTVDRSASALRDLPRAK